MTPPPTRVPLPPVAVPLAAPPVIVVKVVAFPTESVVVITTAVALPAAVGLAVVVVIEALPDGEVPTPEMVEV